MHITSHQETAKRRPVNLTVREDILDEAKALQLNASKAAEEGIINAIKDARAREWLESNKLALKAHNSRVEKLGTLLTPNWVSE